MTYPQDPHTKNLAELFPSLSDDQRKEMRDFLDEYCTIALQIFDRLNREKNDPIDTQ